MHKLGELLAPLIAGMVIQDFINERIDLDSKKNKEAWAITMLVLFIIAMFL